MLRTKKLKNKIISRETSFDGETKIMIVDIDLGVKKFQKRIDRTNKNLALQKKQDHIAKLIAQKKFTKAKESITADSQWKNIFALYTMYAQICFTEQNYDEAYEWLHKGLKEVPNDEQLTYVLARCTGKMKRITEMRAHFEKTEDWKNSSTHLKEAVLIYDEMGILPNQTDLLEPLEKIIAKNPLLSHPLFFEGMHHAFKNEFDKALVKHLEYYQSLNELDKIQATGLIGDAYYTNLNFHEAAKYYDYASFVQLSSKENHHRKCALAPYLSGEHQRTEVLLNIFKAQLPNDEDIARSIAALHAFTFHPDTLKTVEEFEKNIPSIRDELCVARAHYYYQDNHKKAIQILETGLQKYPYCQSIYYNLIVCYLAANQRNKAEEILAFSKTKMPEFTLLHTRLATYLASPVTPINNLFREDNKLYRALKVKFAANLANAFDLVATAAGVHPTFLQGSALYTLIDSSPKNHKPLTVSDWDFLILCDDITTFKLDGFEKISNTEYKCKFETKWLNIRVMNEVDYRLEILTCKDRIPFTLLLGEKNGNVIDPSGLGIQDIEHRFIRIIGQAKHLLDTQPHHLTMIRRYQAEHFETEPSLKQALIELEKKRSYLLPAAPLQRIDVAKQTAQPAINKTKLRNPNELDDGTSEITEAIEKLSLLDFTPKPQTTPYSAPISPSKTSVATQTDSSIIPFFNVEMTHGSFWSGQNNIICEMLNYYIIKGVEYPHFPNDHVVLVNPELHIVNIYKDQSSGQRYIIDQCNVHWPLLANNETAYVDKDLNIKSTQKRIYCSHLGIFAYLKSNQPKHNEEPLECKTLRSSI